MAASDWMCFSPSTLLHSPSQKSKRYIRERKTRKKSWGRTEKYDDDRRRFFFHFSLSLAEEKKKTVIIIIIILLYWKKEAGLSLLRDVIIATGSSSTTHACQKKKIRWWFCRGVVVSCVMTTMSVVRALPWPPQGGLHIFASSGFRTGSINYSVHWSGC